MSRSDVAAGGGETTRVGILLVEDSATDAKLIATELVRAGLWFEIERVLDTESMRAALLRREWDLVLCDWFLPTLTAPEALGVLKEVRPDVPCIILSGSVGEHHAVDAMRAGASDYVLKDRLARLAPAVERELRESQARRRQRRTEARFHAVVERSSNAVTLTTEDGVIEYASPAAGAILGRSPESLVGTRFIDHVYPADRELASRSWSNEARAGEPALTVELRLETPDGSPRWVEATWVFKLGDPDIAAVICNFHDISERRRALEAEAALRHSEAQLRHAQKLEAIGRLAGGVAHDFNNILSVVLCYIEACLSDLDPSDPHRGDLEEVKTAGERGAALTRQLLLFSRQRALEPVVTDVNEAIASTAKMLKRILGEDVHTTARGYHESVLVKLAPGQLEQILMNLVVNARDAMPKGGVMTIEAAIVSPDDAHAIPDSEGKGQHVMIAVADNGIGMDKETQARIFEPFFTTKAPGRGTGLGLSTVFGIVRQAGGDVRVESELGKGTTFRVYLPQVRAEVPPDGDVVALSTLRGTETIFVVEDDAQVRAVVVRSLRRYGYAVLEAKDPSEALASCRHHPGRIHLLLTDVVMPAMSGLALARVFKALRPEVKLMCMSGYTHESVDHEGLAEVGASFVQKPLTPLALLTQLRRALDGDVDKG